MNSPIPMSVVDAFAEQPFTGNPAAVVLLPSWPSDAWLHNLGREMNLSETACLVRRGDSEFELRWFTPAVEVVLCGHATLASAHALWEWRVASNSVLTFHTKSGPLTASPLAGGTIELDFPARPASACEPPPGLLAALGVEAAFVGKNCEDHLVVLASEAEVRAMRPDFAKLGTVQSRGTIVTAASRDPRFHFVSRFFAPQAGIDEDPVTGSAHCCLSEYWGERLGLAELNGYQASARGGIVGVIRRGPRVGLRGTAVTVSRGELLVSPH